MQISQHFHLLELVKSETADRMGHTMEIEPGSLIAANAERLIYMIMEPLRELVARPIIINSAYRDEHINRIVGGHPDSQHKHGLAADITVVGSTAAEVFEIARRSDIPFDQCINEFDRWLHVSVARALVMPRREFLIARRVAGVTQYEAVTDRRGYA